METLEISCLSQGQLPGKIAWQGREGTRASGKEPWARRHRTRSLILILLIV